MVKQNTMLVWASMGSLLFVMGLFILVQNSFNSVPHGISGYGASVLAICFGGSIIAWLTDSSKETKE